MIPLGILAASQRRSDAPSVAYAEAVMESLPAAWWRFSEASGALVACLGNDPVDGDARNGVTRGASLCGEAADHSGVWTTNTSYVLTGGPSYLALASGFTYEAIVRFPPLEAAESINIMGHGFFGAQFGITRHGPDGGGRIRFLLSHIAERGVGSRILLPNTPYHVAIHVEPSGVTRCFVNGYFDANLVTASDYGAPQCPFNIGCDMRFTDPLAVWRGTIDEVAVYKRAVPASELRLHAAAAGLNSTSD